MSLKRAFLAVVFCLACQLRAGEFRSYEPINSPAAAPEGATVLRTIEPLDRQVLEQLIRELLAAWNDTGFSGRLSEEYYDKSRLLEAMDEKVPRDATLRILAIQHIQTLIQYATTTAEGDAIVSTVSAAVATQIEYNDPVEGFKKHEGVNEFIFNVTQLQSTQ